jgi:hypothetical protein
MERRLPDVHMSRPILTARAAPRNFAVSTMAQGRVAQWVRPSLYPVCLCL